MYAGVDGHRLSLKLRLFCIAANGNRKDKRLSRRDQFLGCHSNVACDLAQKRWRDVSSTMIGHCRRPAVGVAELHVRSTLANANKTECNQQGDNFAGF
jgi:hypothetical protein